MPGIFGGSLFGQQAPTQGLDPDQAQSLGIIQAMQQSQNAGMQRTASPMGSIAQNLLPIFAAMIYSKAAQAQSAQQAQDEALKQQSAQADIDYRKALTDKANRTETAQTDPYKGLPAEIRARMNPDPAVQQAVQAEEDAKDRRAQFAAGLMTQRGEQLAQNREEMKLRQDRAKVIDGRGGVYVYDPNTAERIIGARQGEIDDQGLTPLTRQDSDALSSATVAAKQLGEIRALSEKVLPKYKDGFLNRAMTIGGNVVEQSKRNPELEKFNMLSNFANLPEIRALNRGGKIPLAEVQRLSKSADMWDTQESAAEKGDGMMDMLRQVANGMKINPSVLDNAFQEGYAKSKGDAATGEGPGLVTPSAAPTAPTAPKSTTIPQQLDVDVPAKYSQQAIKIFNEVSASHGATAGAVAVQAWLKSQPQ